MDDDLRLPRDYRAVVGLLCCWSAAAWSAWYTVLLVRCCLVCWWWSETMACVRCHSRGQPRVCFYSHSVCRWGSRSALSAVASGTLLQSLSTTATACGFMPAPASQPSVVTCSPTRPVVAPSPSPYTGQAGPSVNSFREIRFLLRLFASMPSGSRRRFGAASRQICRKIDQ